MLALPAQDRDLRLEQALAQLGEATWREMEAGVSTGQVLSEESITDFNLMRLASAVPRQVAIRKHNRSEENASGADWELWVGSPGAFVGFRVQAKRLFSTSRKYESLKGEPPPARSQTADLIRSAATASPQCYPLYAFYNYWNADRHPDGLAACCLARSNFRLNGWTVVSAHHVARHLAPGARWGASDFAHVAHPIACLFVDPLTVLVDQPNQRAAGLGPSRRPLAEMVAQRVNSLWGGVHTRRAGPGRLRAPEAGVTEHAPEYVEAMFDRLSAGGSLADRVVGGDDLSVPPNLSRVVLVADRTE